MPAPFGSSARRLQGDVRGSAERAKRPHSASSGGFQPSRKSFFRSLDADERAALLKVAPSLRCARRRRPRARPFLSPRDRRDRPDAASKRDMRLTLPRPLARFTSVPRRATFQTPAPRGRADLDLDDDDFDRVVPESKAAETQTPVAKMTSTASSGSPPEGAKPEDATPPKPRRPPRASAATTARGTTSTPPKPTTPLDVVVELP